MEYFLENIVGINDIEVILCFRILVATLLGILIGIQRGKVKNSHSILRIHILICIGACLVASISEYLMFSNISTDVTRMAAQVISGIGFICMAVIMKNKDNHISGLTTATTIWIAGLIGIAIGFACYLLGIVVTILVLVILNSIKEEQDINEQVNNKQH